MIIPHICVVAHRPPESHGDCVRACIASILRVEEVTDVPHFLHDGDDEAGLKRQTDWLLERGYRALTIGIDSEDTLDDVFGMMAAVNPGIPYILYCQSGGGDHAVVCLGGEMLHNPAWVRSPITGPNSQGLWGIVVLVKVEI